MPGTPLQNIILWCAVFLSHYSATARAAITDSKGARTRRPLSGRNITMMNRRHILEAGGALVGTGWLSSLPAESAGLDLPAALPAGTRAEATLAALPGKKPLIRLTNRPPNYETPIEYFRTPITPNDAFFVRYHLSDIPEVDAKTWKLAVGGEGTDGQIELTLDNLKAMPAQEITAV